MQTGPVMIIDGDPDDQMMIKEVWTELNLSNELIFLEGAEDALDRLCHMTSAPFIIICELNLPAISGFELREKMLESHARILRSVPFIFWSTFVSEEQILHAYDLSVHGFFIKDNSLQELKETFTSIIQYWRKSKMPSKTVLS